MLFLYTAVDQEIVAVCGAGQVEVLSQGIVNESLEGGRGASQFKLHDERVEEPECRAESGQMFLARIHADVVRGENDVNLREELHALQII